jgi:hypothetical protein
MNIGPVVGRDRVLVPRPRRARQPKAQAVEHAFPRPRDGAVAIKAEGRGRAAFNCALGRVKRQTSPIEP